MRVALTGASGFVGRSVLKHFRMLGHDVISLARTSSGALGEVVTGNLAEALINPSILTGVDAVLHLAGRAHIMHDAANAVEAYRSTNVEGTVHLAEAAIAAGVPRFVYMSSIKVNGERTEPGAPFTPYSAEWPVDAYGLSKWEAEQALHALYENAGLDWVVIRPPLVYGRGVGANFGRILRLAMSGVPLPFGGLNNRRSLIHVDNLADACVRACVAPGAARRTLLLTDNRDISTAELVRAVAAAAGLHPRLISVPPSLLRLGGRLLNRSAEIERLAGWLQVDPFASMTALDWLPPLSFEEGIARSLPKKD